MGVTPVPIPNTMVKPQTADGTALETKWESRWLPRLKFMGWIESAQAALRSRRRHLASAMQDSWHDCCAILPFGGVAQLGEHLPCKQGVMSSNLTISTKVMKRMLGVWTEAGDRIHASEPGCVQTRGYSKNTRDEQKRSFCEFRVNDYLSLHLEN